MTKMKWWLMVSLILLLVSSTLLAACTSPAATTTSQPPATTTVAPTTTSPPAQPITLKIGGTFALTGAFAEDVTACLAAFQDYAQWVNENHIVAPWYPDKKIPSNVTFEVLWGDDKLTADLALSIYEQQKSQGILASRVTSSVAGLALIQRFAEDQFGATTMSAGPYVLTASQNIFPNYPIYTDSLAAVADWFKANWKDTSRKPRVAFLTANSAMGKQIDIPEFEAYLVSAGFEFAGKQFVDQVPTSPPTTALAWLKDNRVDLALGVMINPGSQPTIKEAVRLGMGSALDYKITFGLALPSHLQVFAPAMGQSGNGVVLGGGYPSWDATSDGVKFAATIKAKGHPSINHPLYFGGLVEAMTQVEAIRLAAAQSAYDKIKPADVLKNGFYQIKNLSMGGITSSPLSYGPSYSQGVDNVRVQQAQDGKILELGAYPLHNIYNKQ